AAPLELPRTVSPRSRAPHSRRWAFFSRLLEVLGQPLDIPTQMVPLGHEGPNELGRAPGAEVLDFSRENVPVARGLAQNRVQSPVSLLEGREKVGVELVDGPVARGRCRYGAFHGVCLLLQVFRHFSMFATKEASSIPEARMLESSMIAKHRRRRRSRIVNFSYA